MTPGMVHENDAAARLTALCRNEHMAESEVKEGKIELKAEIDGLFRVDVERLNAINLLDEIMIATRHNNFPVRAGDKLCGTRVIPLIIQDEKLRRAEALAGDTPILELLPYKLKAAGVITTGSEVASGRIQDTFTPILAKKLQAYGITMTEHLTVSDGLEQVAAAIESPNASRAVGMANNKNPLIIIIPCHRVIGSDGSLVGYAASLQMKKRLLDLEQLHKND